jgi:hypothetical protein
MAVNPLQEILRRRNLLNKFKPEFIDYFSNADLAINWLHSSDLNYKKSTRHPTELGHEVWADYLYNEILKKTN